MLAQHLITKPVFDALFEGYSFAEHNPVSRVMEDMLAALDEQNLEKEQQSLEQFYASVRVRAEGIDNAEGKQQIITELYEKFFKIAFPAAAESLGIVYTPVEVVDFIMRSVEQVLQARVRGVPQRRGCARSRPVHRHRHVHHPAAAERPHSARGPAPQVHQELHANEIVLLAYYIAAINIEATFHGLAGGDYVPFDGIVLTDTFQIAEAGDTMDEVIFPENNARVPHRRALDIRVIVGNPPYSAGQKQPERRQRRICSTRRSTKPLLSPTRREVFGRVLNEILYDCYIRAFRWASGPRSTSQAASSRFVTNGSFIDGGSADGFADAR